MHVHRHWLRHARTHAGIETRVSLGWPNWISGMIVRRRFGLEILRPKAKTRFAHRSVETAFTSRDAIEEYLRSLNGQVNPARPYIRPAHIRARVRAYVRIPISTHALAAQPTVSRGIRFTE